MKKAKKLKVVFLPGVKEKIASLPKKDQEVIAKGIRKILKNPTATPGSMNLFGPPSPQELRQWMDKVKPETTDLVMEYLRDKDCLNKKGLKLAHNFWTTYIHKEKARH